MIDFWTDAGQSCRAHFGAAGQFGIFLTLILALALGFARGRRSLSQLSARVTGLPPSMLPQNSLSNITAISVAAYSYMSLVPIIQPRSCEH